MSFGSKYLLLLFCGLISFSACSKSEQSAVLIVATGLSLGEEATFNGYFGGGTSSSYQVVLTGTDEATVTGELHSGINRNSFLIRATTSPAGKKCTIEHDGNNVEAYGYLNDETETIYAVCSSTQRTISGTVTGLASGNEVHIVVNGELSATMTANGAFNVSGSIADGSRYRVAYVDLPKNQRCSSNADEGTIDGDLTLDIVCSYVNLLFAGVTNSTVVRGDFGASTSARTYADNYCQQLAEGAYADYLSCDSVKAFISVSASDEIRDIPDLNASFNPALAIHNVFASENSNRYFSDELLNPKVADSWSDLLDGTTDNSARIETFWTGSDSSGAIAGNACSGWTSRGGSGNASFGTQNALFGSATSCGFSFQIACLCIQDQEAQGNVHYLFPTLEEFQGNFGNRATADALCATAKENDYSSLSCDGVAAFVSYSSTDEVQDFPDLYNLNTSIEIQDANNASAKIADNWDDLLDGNIDQALTANWWSDTLIDSTTNHGVSGGFNCSSWTSNSSSLMAGVGQSGESSDYWAGTSDGTCDQMLPLMCLCYQEE